MVFLGSDQATGMPTLTLARIRLRSGAIRGPFRFDASNGHPPLPSPAARFGMGGCEASCSPALADGETDAESDGPTMPDPATGGLPPMPLSFRVTLVGDQKPSALS